MVSEPRVPVVVYDACVLYPLNLRNAVVQCAVDRLARARWSDDIHEEWIRNLLEANPGLARERLERTRRLMDRALPDALVAGHRRHIPAVSMPDPKDRHVVAAAIEAGAEAVVSADRHFRDGDLQPHGLAVWRPGDFLMRLYRADPEATVACMANARRNLRRSAPTSAEFVAGLRRTGKLDDFCGALDRHLSDL
ncbi:PIN domain-containing protein [Belnapia rosea]|uniref:PIN domain-containing protein n=1 Tax=Belnapia rosea TaxID=938405 RepID=UPI000885F431|nr:PIN domain-containing protein [Belnapia rosea]SDB74271.1 PIN domain-containing protein [Belnapia rosea]